MSSSVILLKLFLGFALASSLATIRLMIRVGFFVIASTCNLYISWHISLRCWKHLYSSNWSCGVVNLQSCNTSAKYMTVGFSSFDKSSSIFEARASLISTRISSCMSNAAVKFTKLFLFNPLRLIIGRHFCNHPTYC